MANQVEIKPSKQESCCRLCDKWIPKGEIKLSFYSHRNTGMWIHLHLDCAKELGKLAEENQDG